MAQDIKTIQQLEQELAIAKARIAELEALARPPGGDALPPANRAGATRELLHLFATAGTRESYLDSVRDLLSRWSGCQCVGIRLTDHKRQIPYQSYRGFDREFWQQENCLSLDRDQCVCIRVVGGCPEAQDKPYLTAGGSFVCNDTDKLVTGASKQELKRFRGTCMQAGYKSITVLPLRYRDRVIGAIHMADSQAARFDASVIEIIEALSPLIGEATHRFDMEDSLRQSHELFERTFESIDLHLAYMDRDFHFIRVNRGYAAADGRTPDYFVGRNHFALYPNAENERIFRRVVETGEPFSVLARPFEYTHNPSRGVTYWDWSLQPVKGTDGCVEGLVLCLINVTDREQARAALSERDVQFHAVFDQTHQLMALLSKDGRVLQLNRAAAGVHSQEQPNMGPMLWELSRWDGRPKVCDRLKRAVIEAAQGHVAQFEAEAVRPDGSEVIIDLSVKPVRDACGQIVYLITEGHDITLRKHLERQLLEISSREQRRIGQDLHDVLGQNLTGLAFLTRILEQKLASKSIPEAQDAAKVGEVIKQAIAQTRALSRGLCPIDQKADGLMTALQALAGNVTEFYGVSCLFESQQPVLVNDMTAAMHLYHIAQEAINNAIKHGKADQVRVSLTPEHEGFALSIRDNGCGIPEHLGPVKGIGLNIMKYRAGMIGGTLDIKRHPEGGTVVTCTYRDSFGPRLDDGADSHDAAT